MILLALAYPFIAAWMMGAGRNRRLSELEEEVSALRRVIDGWKNPSVPDRERPAEVTPARQDLQARIEREFPIRVVAPPEPGSATAAPVRTPLVGDEAWGVEPGTASPPRPAPSRWLMAAKNWLLTGNLVAKLGLVILFVGVGFLLKYVAATVAIPIELRLAGVVLADLALLGWGWRMRTARREIGLPIQGTAIAILMLVIFGAYHRYDLIPAAFAFALLVALTAFTCLLAVLQDAPWLAAFGITGGFACPLLISAGEGNHIALFSYYALLNAGVFGLAIKRAWRPLNLLGFGFTFILGSAWGGLQYTSASYGSAQGFLLLFFLMYVGIAIAFARQQQTRLKHYVDATLVLGTPLLAFGLQVGLVRDKPFGLALSSLALGGFYLVLALLLLRRGRERWRVLVETFVALGAIFGTLAIPFALDGRWTSAAWALEGAGFVWFGLRRGQRATWMFGLLLQAGAWLSFIGAATGLDPDAARNANLGLGFLLLAGSAFAMARNFHQHAGEAEPVLARIANWSITIAALWLLAGTWTEAIVRTSGSTLANLLAAGALLTAALLYLSSARLEWPQARRLALAAQLAGAAALAAVMVAGWLWGGIAEGASGGPLLGVLMIALAALATSRMLDRSPEEPAGKRLAAAMLLWGGAWWFGPAIHIGANRLIFDLPSVLGTAQDRWILVCSRCRRVGRRMPALGAASRLAAPVWAGRDELGHAGPCHRGCACNPLRRSRAACPGHLAGVGGALGGQRIYRAALEGRPEPAPACRARGPYRRAMAGALACRRNLDRALAGRVGRCRYPCGAGKLGDQSRMGELLADLGDDAGAKLAGPAQRRRNLADRPLARLVPDAVDPFRRAPDPAARRPVEPLARRSDGALALYSVDQSARPDDRIRPDSGCRRGQGAGTRACQP